MKTLKIQRSRKKSVGYLVLSTILLVVIIYLFITDKVEYPKGNSPYWIGIGLFGLTTFYFIYELINKTPLYIIDSDGIHVGSSKKTIPWGDLFYFECQIIYSRYVTTNQVLFFDRNENEVLTIDLTLTDIPLEKLESLLKIKLKQK